MPRPRPLLLAALAGLLAPALPAQPLSKALEIDFSREVLSRNLKGLAVRSDGRVLPGPTFTDLAGPPIAEVLWSLRPAGANRFLVGTGPEGKVHEVTFDPANDRYTTRLVADVAENHALAVLALPDGVVLVGTSPSGALYLFRDGQAVARVPLPADSVFDLLALPDGTVLAATGNPGRIFRVAPDLLAKAGLNEGPALAPLDQAAKGVVLFASVRDRNLRRLARLADGRIAAGSAPRGTVYAFPAPGAFDPAAGPAEPVILHELRDTEVVDLLPEPDGGLYAAFVSSPGDDSRIAPRVTALTPPPAVTTPGPEPRPAPAFAGRSTVVRISSDGFAETVALRNNIALYRLGRHEGWLLLTAGEQGDAFGYDPAVRRSLTFPGSGSAQLNDIVPLGDGRHLVLRNNAPGLSLLAFSGLAVRELETKRLDLGGPAELGTFRFDRARDLPPGVLRVEARTNLGSDEVEGWGPWVELVPQDGGYRADGLRGRYVKLRLRFAGGPADFLLEKASLFHLPQNRRPQLADFRIFPPNLGLLPQPEQPPVNPVSTLAQWLAPTGAGSGDAAADRRKNPFLNSQVVPAPGTQIVYWSVSDPDNDTLAFTFSIRPDAAADWTDLAVATRDSFTQFETTHLPEGHYRTRLRVEEQAPRPAGQRLDLVFETDALIVDRTAPVILDATAARADGLVRVAVTGRDERSLLEGAQFVFNNGLKEIVTQPADGIRDGRTETFVAEVPAARAAGATSVEIVLVDQAGNSASTRLPLLP